MRKLPPPRMGAGPAFTFVLVFMASSFLPVWLQSSHQVTSQALAVDFVG
jgi:hypothetical protein